MFLCLLLDLKLEKKTTQHYNDPMYVIVWQHVDREGGVQRVPLKQNSTVYIKRRGLLLLLFVFLFSSEFISNGDGRLFNCFHSHSSIEFLLLLLLCFLYNCYFFHFERNWNIKYDEAAVTHTHFICMNLKRSAICVNNNNNNKKEFKCYFYFFLF